MAEYELDVTADQILHVSLRLDKFPHWEKRPAQ